MRAHPRPVDSLWHAFDGTVLLSPVYRIELALHGIVLDDVLMLSEMHLASCAILDMRLLRVPSEVLATRGLGRVRVGCPLLRTRALPADETTTVLDLKCASRATRASPAIR